MLYQQLKLIMPAYKVIVIVFLILNKVAKENSVQIY